MVVRTSLWPRSSWTVRRFYWGNGIAVFDQVGGERVAQGVAGAGFGDLGQGDGGFDGPLQRLFAEVMAADEAGAGIGGEGAGGEDPRPGPFLGGVRILAGKGIGQGDVGLVGGEVLGVDGPHLREMLGQRVSQPPGEHGEAVLLPFAVEDGDLAHFQVHVFDAPLFAALCGGVNSRRHSMRRRPDP